MPHPLETPAKKQSKWSAEENTRIIELRAANMKWEDISKRLPGRSAISCRLHYQNFLERKAEWDEEKDNKLSRLYDRFKREMWEKIAADLHMPWRAVEARHWELGAEGLALRAGVPLFASSASATADTPTTPSAMAHVRIPTTSWRPPYGYASPQAEYRHSAQYLNSQTLSPQGQMQQPHQHPPPYPSYRPYPHYTTPPEHYSQHHQPLPPPPPPPIRTSTSAATSPSHHHAPPPVRSASPTGGRWIPPRYSMPQPPPPVSQPPSSSSYTPLPPPQGERLPPMRLLTEPRELSQPLENLTHVRPPASAPVDSARPSPWSNTPQATPDGISDGSSGGSKSR